MNFRVVHTTRYRYSQPVTHGHSEAHLRPRACDRQRCIESTIVIEPPPARSRERLDYFGNPVLYFTLQEPHVELEVTATSDVEMATAKRELPASGPWDTVAPRLGARTDEASLGARELILSSPLAQPNAELAGFAHPSFVPGRPLLEAVHDLSRRIFREFVYDPSFTTIATPLADVLERRRGVCQDFAHLAIGCLRSLGLPARYVSGYVESDSLTGTTGVRGAEASHAWFAVFDPDAGWIDFDPTNDQIVGEQHVTVAWGRDYADVTPLRGVVFGGGGHTLEVEVEMTRTEGGR